MNKPPDKSDDKSDEPLISPASAGVGGRPRLDAAEKLYTVSIRLTLAQRDKLRAIGVDKLRAWLDSYRVKR